MYIFKSQQISDTMETVSISIQQGNGGGQFSFNVSNDTPGMLNGAAMKGQEAFKHWKSTLKGLTLSMPSVLVLLPQSPYATTVAKEVNAFHQVV